jgi:hypothetical protein
LRYHLNYLFNIKALRKNKNNNLILIIITITL